jgi:hypothetical protein
LASPHAPRLPEHLAPRWWRPSLADATPTPCALTSEGWSPFDQGTSSSWTSTSGIKGRPIFIS